MPRLRPSLILVSLLVLAACASGRPDGGPERDGRRGVPNLFISPAGQPFRAELGQPYPVAAWFAAADADHDGRLTAGEFRADAAAFFKQLDANGDGVIDGFELQRYETTVAPEINPEVEGLRFGEGMDLSLGSGKPGQIGKSPRAGREQAGDRRPEGAGLYGLLNEPEPVAAADTRFDSRITLAEFQAAADRRFALLDKTGRGYLMLGDLPKTPAQRVLERLERQRAQRAKDLPK